MDKWPVACDAAGVFETFPEGELGESTGKEKRGA
jgi:hypothetical protein